MDLENLDCVKRHLLAHATKVKRRMDAGEALDVSSMVLTYGDLSKATKVGIARGMGVYLDEIARLDALRGVPGLDCLVVSKSTGRPNAEKFAGSDWEMMVRRCIECIDTPRMH